MFFVERVAMSASTCPPATLESAREAIGNTRTIVFTALDATYLSFLEPWQSRFADFSRLSWPLVLALDDNVVARRGRRESDGGLARVVAEARRLTLRCLTYDSRALTSIAPVRGKRGFDELGRELGRKDLVVFRVYAMLLRAIGARGKLIFSEMDVFWRRSPSALLASLDGEGDALRCMANDRNPTSRNCNIGLLAAVASGEQRVATALDCVADRWEAALLAGDGSRGSHGQSFFNRAIGSKGECRIDRVQRLPPDAYATNQPRGPGSNPSWGNVTRGTTRAVHLTAMCFERGCGAELPNGAKLAVLHALYHRGAWPPPATYCRLADVHRPMVRELFGGQGDWLGSEAQLGWLGSEAQLKASDPGWRASCAPA